MCSKFSRDRTSHMRAYNITRRHLFDSTGIISIINIISRHRVYVHNVESIGLVVVRVCAPSDVLYVRQYCVHKHGALGNRKRGGRSAPRAKRS